MNEEESHLVLPLLLEQQSQWDGVGGKANDEQDGVSDDGYDLCLTKLHILWQREVGRDICFAWKNVISKTFLLKINCRS